MVLIPAIYSAQPCPMEEAQELTGDRRNRRSQCGRKRRSYGPSSERWKRVERPLGRLDDDGFPKSVPLALSGYNMLCFPLDRPHIREYVKHPKTHFGVVAFVRLDFWDGILERQWGAAGSREGNPYQVLPVGSTPTASTSTFADAFESHRLFDTAAWLSWFKAGDL
jgi:hypothetical protein